MNEGKQTARKVLILCVYNIYISLYHNNGFIRIHHWLQVYDMEQLRIRICSRVLDRFHHCYVLVLFRGSKWNCSFGHVQVSHLPMSNGNCLCQATHLVSSNVFSMEYPKQLCGSKSSFPGRRSCFVQKMRDQAAGRPVEGAVAMALRAVACKRREAVRTTTSH